jgi:hypothetical protein
MIKNHMREYDKMSTYWHVDSIDKFENVEVHGILGDVKYLCCISCQSEIVGFWLISVRIYFLSYMWLLLCRTRANYMWHAPGWRSKFEDEIL